VRFEVLEPAAPDGVAPHLVAAAVHLDHQSGQLVRSQTRAEVTDTVPIDPRTHAATPVHSTMATIFVDDRGRLDPAALLLQSPERQLSRRLEQLGLRLRNLRRHVGDLSRLRLR
jgi:hypothetical protein